MYFIFNSSCFAIWAQKFSSCYIIFEKQPSSSRIVVTLTGLRVQKVGKFSTMLFAIYLS